MPFLASNIVPVQAYADAKALAVSIKAQAASFKARITLGTNADVVLDCLRNLIRIESRFNALKSVPGIVEYARQQESNATYDVAAEFNALLAAIADARAWIEAALPRDGGGYVLIYQLAGDGNFTPRAFSSVQVAPLLLKLQAIVDAVS